MLSEFSAEPTRDRCPAEYYQDMVGQKAPSFKAVDVYGNTVTLEVGKKKVLAFLRHIGCPYCQRDVMILVSKAKLLEGKDVFVFSTSPSEVLRKYIEMVRFFPYRMISDPEKRIYKMYGVEDGGIRDFISPSSIISSLKMLPESIANYKFIPEGVLDRYLFTRPAIFVVNEQNVITYAQKKERVTSQFLVEEVLAHL